MVRQLDLPNFTRASDIPGIDQCGLGWLNSKIYEDEIPTWGYWMTGTATHYGIELSIGNDFSVEDGVEMALEHFDELIDRAGRRGQFVRWTKKKPRNMAEQNIERWIRTWFDQVPPGAPNRHPIYDKYEWPPKTEVRIDALLGEHPDHDDWECPDVLLCKNHLYTEADAIFEHKSGDQIGIPDWKTGATGIKNIQLWIYYRGLRAMGEERIFTGWFHNLEEGKVKFVEMLYPGDDYIDALIARAESKKQPERLWEMLPAPTAPDWFCKYCLVQDKCPVFSEQGTLPNLDEFDIRYLDPDAYYVGSRDS